MKEFINNYEAQTGENFVDRQSELDLDKLEHILKAGNANKEDFKNFQLYLKLIQDRCREKWSTFNITICLLGILLMVFSILNLSLFLIDEKKSSESQQNLVSKLLKSIIPIFGLLFLISNSNVDSNVSFAILWLFFNVFLFLNITWSNSSTLSKYQSIFLDLFKGEHFLYLLVLLVPFSNSYIVLENISLRFILISMFSYELFTRLKQQAKVDRPFLIRKLIEIGSICVLIRFTSLFYTCREEALLLECTQNIFSTQITKVSFANESSFLVYLGFISFNFTAMCSIIFYLLRPYLNRLNFSKLNYLIALESLLLLTYWTLQLVINAFQISLTSQLNRAAINLPLVFYVCFILSILLNCLSKDQYSKPQDSYLSSVTYLLVNFGLLISLVSGESALAIWILILILGIYANHRSSWKQGKSLEIEHRAFNTSFMLFVELKRVLNTNRLQSDSCIVTALLLLRNRP